MDVTCVSNSQGAHVGLALAHVVHDVGPIGAQTGMRKLVTTIIRDGLTWLSVLSGCTYTGRGSFLATAATCGSTRGSTTAQVRQYLAGQQNIPHLLGWRSYRLMVYYS